MRIAVGSIMQETNTFAPDLMGLDAFAADYLLRGEEVLTGLAGARVEIPGMLSVLGDGGAEPVPLIAAHACSGGPVTRAAFDRLLGDLLAGLRHAMPVDGVLLALHGAMALEDNPDAEGEILAAVRALVGPGVKVAASLDLHGHITPQMVQNADILVGYSCYPHTDMFETGVHTARLLLGAVRGEIRPRMALAKRPMVTNPMVTRTVEGPFQALMAEAKELERNGHALAASLFTVQLWMDVPDLGFAALVVTDGDHAGAAQMAEGLADRTWAVRAELVHGGVPLEEALDAALQPGNGGGGGPGSGVPGGGSPGGGSPGGGGPGGGGPAAGGPGGGTGPVVIGDSGDAPSSGAPGSSNAVLRALLARGVDRSAARVYLTLVDPAAVAAAAKAGVGARLTVAAGRCFRGGGPVTVTGWVRTLFAGRFRLKGPGATGVAVNAGPTAVLVIGNIHLVLLSLPVMEWDPTIYEVVGLPPADADLIFVKSPGHFRVAYGPIARQVITTLTPGCSSCDIRSLTFQHVTRPLYPLDQF